MVQMQILIRFSNVDSKMNLPPLDAMSKVENLKKSSPFASDSVVTVKKKPKKKLDPAEVKMREAIRRAAKGDQDALFDHFIGSEVLQGIVKETAVDMEPEAEVPEEFVQAQIELNLKNAAISDPDSAPVSEASEGVDKTSNVDANISESNVTGEKREEVVLQTMADSTSGIPPTS